MSIVSRLETLLLNGTRQCNWIIIANLIANATSLFHVLKRVKEGRLKPGAPRCCPVPWSLDPVSGEGVKSRAGSQLCCEQTGQAVTERLKTLFLICTTEERVLA